MALAPITEEQRRRVKEEIGYVDEEMQNKVTLIKEWMKKQPHLPEIPETFSEKLIHKLLVGTKLSAERTKYKLDMFYSMRHQIPEVFACRDPSAQDVRDSLDKIRIFPLSELTPEGIRVYFTMCNPEGEKFTTKDYGASYKRFISVDQVMMLQGEFCAGIYLVYDCRGFYFSHIAELSWPLVMKLSTYVQEAMPHRIKKILLIHTPKYIELALNFVNPILKDKIKKRIQIFEGDHTNLYQYIPQRILPSDMGGEAPPSEELNWAWQKTIEGMRDTILEDEKLITDESKRPKDSKNYDGQLFGINGSFSRLNID